jgi:hypothetical protein
MNKLGIILCASAMSFAGAATQTFTGVITDAMCGNNHAMMNVTPEAKCVRECVKGGSKYAIFDGKKAYKLSDQQTPAHFAGQKVKITGTLFTKTGVIEVKSIEAVK